MADSHDSDRLPGLPRPEQLEIRRLGEARVTSPLAAAGEPFVSEDDRVLVCSTIRELRALSTQEPAIPTFEPAGPREKLFFDPGEVSCGIVTCGGLCPGINDVIRSIVLTATHRYGIRRILGFRYGYAGLSRAAYREPVFLETATVEYAHLHGGTLLGTSRGPRDLGEMVDTLVNWKVNLLFAIGGDGTLRGASALAAEIARRNLKIAVVGIPKTIDNDLLWVERSFGFATAVEQARAALEAAHAEARAAWNGIGLVKLMGRQSGFIAAYATLANGDVNFCLVPEAPFSLEGEGGFLDALEKRLLHRRHAVVVVAEGTGQELLRRAGAEDRDASGNPRLEDIGIFLESRMATHFAERGLEVTIKYIDPSYTIRSTPANSQDSVFCLVLGQHAVHAAMAGSTDMMVGYWNQRFTHVPLPLVTAGRKRIDPGEPLWQRVLGATGQRAMV